MSRETIRERAVRIRLGQKQLAAKARLSQKSVNMILNGKSGGHHASVVAIDEALTAEELALRDYLLALHPIKTEEKAA